MVEAAFGLEPEIGTSLEALPFPSADHRARAVASVSSMMDAAPAGTIFHPHRALSAVTHAKPSVIIHLSSHVSVGLNAATDIVFCMSAAKIIASSVRASGDAVPPLSSGAPYHVLVMGKESQFDPSLSSLVNTEASYNEQRSDVVSDLTSGEWLGSTPVRSILLRLRMSSICFPCPLRVVSPTRVGRSKMHVSNNSFFSTRHAVSGC